SPRTCSPRSTRTRCWHRRWRATTATRYSRPVGRPRRSTWYAPSSGGSTHSTRSAPGWIGADDYHGGAAPSALQPRAEPSRVTWHAKVERGGGVAAEEFDELYQAQYGNVVAMAYALTGNLTEAQDLAQEGFCQAWQRWRRIAGYDDP